MLSDGGGPLSPFAVLLMTVGRVDPELLMLLLAFVPGAAFCGVGPPFTTCVEQALPIKKNSIENVTLFPLQKLFCSSYSRTGRTYWSFRILFDLLFSDSNERERERAVRSMINQVQGS